MARLNYSRLKATATRLIGNAGQPGFLRRETPAIPDPDRPWDLGEPTFTDYACTFIEDNFTAYERANSLVQENDRKLVVSASVAVEPLPTDKFVIGNIVLDIVPPVTRVSPGGAALMFTIQARG